MDIAEFFNGRKVLVTGGTGLIGRPLVDRLVAAGAKVKIASLDDPSRVQPGVEFVRADLRFFGECLGVCRGMDCVFHLAGVKGSPAVTKSRPASFFVPTTMFNTALLEAARVQDVQSILYTSSIGVYSPAPVLREEDVWSTFPSPNDRFAGWAKRMGELQCEAYSIEYGPGRYVVVRPANVYGPFDHFAGDDAMVVPSLIRKLAESSGILEVWGDGSPVRDLVYSDDVACGMMQAAKCGRPGPFNLGCGVGYSIRELVETLVRVSGKEVEVKWLTDKPSGDACRLMDIGKAQFEIGYQPLTSLEEGLRKTWEWYTTVGKSTVEAHSVFSGR